MFTLPFRLFDLGIKAAFGFWISGRVTHVDGAETFLNGSMLDRNTRMSANFLHALPGCDISRPRTHRLWSVRLLVPVISKFLRVRVLEMRKSPVTLGNLLGEPVGLGRLIVG